MGPADGFCSNKKIKKSLKYQSKSHCNKWLTLFLKVITSARLQCVLDSKKKKLQNKLSKSVHG